MLWDCRMEAAFCWQQGTYRIKRVSWFGVLGTSVFLDPGTSYRCVLRFKDMHVRFLNVCNEGFC